MKINRGSSIEFGFRLRINSGIVTPRHVSSATLETLLGLGFSISKMREQFLRVPGSELYSGH